MKKSIVLILIITVLASLFAGCSEKSISVSGRTYAFNSLKTEGDTEVMETLCKDMQVAFYADGSAHLVMPAGYFDYREYSFWEQKGSKVYIADNGDMKGEKLQLTVSGDTLTTELSYEETTAQVTFEFKTSPTVYGETFECTDVTFSGTPDENAPQAYAAADLKNEEEYKAYFKNAIKNGQITFYKNGTSYAYFEDEVMYTLFPEDGYWVQEGEYVFLTNIQKAPVDSSTPLYVKGDELSLKYKYVGFDIEYKFKKTVIESVGGKTYEYAGFLMTGEESDPEIRNYLDLIGFTTINEYKEYIEERFEGLKKVKFAQAEECTLGLGSSMKGVYNENSYFIQNGKIVFTSNVYGDWKGDTAMKFHISEEGDLLSGGDSNGIGIYAVYKEQK